MFEFCVFICVEIKYNMKVLDIPCKSTCFGDVERIANLLKNGENDRQIMHKKEQ